MNNLIRSLELPSPIQSFCFQEIPDRRIFIKRDDLIHQHISGNKWRKLKYNIKFAIDNNCDGIISFGGAFSNHLYALAAACELAELKCIAFIRGAKLDLSNPTLSFMLSKGVEIRPIPKKEYRNSFQQEGIEKLKKEYPAYHIIPEGGSNELAHKGVEEIMNEAYDQGMSDQLLVISAVGSGATITGLVKGMRSDSSALGMMAVNDSSLQEKVYKQLTQDEQTKLNFDLETHLGGFARTNAELIKFVNTFFTYTAIPIDVIYTGKLLLRLKILLMEGVIVKNKEILVIHTGGLQGNLGYDYRFPGILDPGLIGQ